MVSLPSFSEILPHLQANDDPIRAAAEAVEPLVQRVLFDAWEEAARSIEVVHGNWRAFAEEIALRLSKQIHPIAQDLLVARALGHQAVARQIAAEIRKDLTTLSFSFGRLADPVQEEADKHAAEFVREIGEDTRTTLAAMIQRGVNEGLPPGRPRGLCGTASD